jgi:hypothetical protein
MITRNMGMIVTQNEEGAGGEFQNTPYVGILV